MHKNPAERTKTGSPPSHGVIGPALGCPPARPRLPLTPNQGIDTPFPQGDPPSATIGIPAPIQRARLA
jgi:hypothetical protein